MIYVLVEHMVIDNITSKTMVTGIEASTFADAKIRLKKALLKLRGKVIIEEDAVSYITYRMEDAAGITHGSMDSAGLGMLED